MADAFVQVIPDSTGKKVQTYENTVGGQTVEAQAMVPVDQTGAPVSLATAAKQDTTNAQLAALNSLVPTAFDYIGLGYTGEDLTTVLFKAGGASGTLVSTLTLAYSSGKLASVTKT